MLAIGLELLAGRYVATAYNDRSRSEWPPHPARFFSALVAAWKSWHPETKEGDEEKIALEWLEGLPAPAILCSSVEDAAQRTALPVYVPANDVSVSAKDADALYTASQELASASDKSSISRATKKLKQCTAALRKEPAVTKNDHQLWSSVLPESRRKNDRRFPSVTPAHSAIGFVWPDSTLPIECVSGLTRLLQRMVRLGHSSSMVSARLLTESDVETLSSETMRFVPDDNSGSQVIRWVNRGQVERLCRAYELHREVEPRVLPATFVRYREGADAPTEAPPCGVFGHADMIVFARVGGPRLPMASTVGVARQFRRALLAAAKHDIPGLLSGHTPDGEALQAAHLAFVPLPVVGNSHADGAIIGLGLIFPRTRIEEDRRKVLAAIGRLEEEQAASDDSPPVISLNLGAGGVLKLQRVAWGEDGRTTLQPGWWARASRTWASATPVALDHHPGDLHDSDLTRRRKAFDEAKATIALAVSRAGYPAPVEIDVVRSCFLSGSVTPKQFPPFPANPNRAKRILVHTRIVFPEPVLGPLLLGAGRYFGLGLHLPVDVSNPAAPRRA